MNTRWDTRKKITSSRLETQVKKKESSVETSATIPNTAFFCGWHDWELDIIPVPLMLISSEKQLLLVVYTANQQQILIQASQWPRKETQQHTQVSVGLFARRFEMVPLWAHRNVSTRTVKHQKDLISSCYPFTQSKALSWVSASLKVSYLMLPSSGDIY